jgi:Cys-tRNA(Pro) deacylase
MHRNTVAVTEYAAARGVQLAPRHFPDSTRTAAEAAAVVGVAVERIVKSLVFRLGEDGVVVALVNGASMCDTDRLSALCDGAAIRRLDADGVRSATGFPIGGVAPFGYPQPLPVFVDSTLTGFDTVWAAAGTPNCNMELTPEELIRLSGGTVADVV